MRFTVLILMVILALATLAGCDVPKEEVAPPANYDEALALMVDEEGLIPDQEELARLRALAKADAAALIALGEDPGDLEGDYIRELLEQRLRDKLFVQVTATPDEIQAWYDARLAALEKALSENPGLFKNQQESYELYGGVPPLIIPDGYIRFKHILVSDEPTAQDILAQLEAGSDFDALLTQYGKDPGMNQEPYRSLGYLAGPYPSQRDFVDELKLAALSLNELWQYSPVVSSPAGYHIVVQVDRWKGRTLPLAEVEDAIGGLLTSSKRQKALEDAVQKRLEP